MKIPFALRIILFEAVILIASLIFAFVLLPLKDDYLKIVVFFLTAMFYNFWFFEQFQREDEIIYG